ncbi:MAG TPA: carboxypeptidase-like regulatory domain-containing protein [Bryobacteraceae bacterium]|nr:carboxypeptidase-like regulatory domain-containing protein [Bryobacteraceae bacterium]
MHRHAVNASAATAGGCARSLWAVGLFLAAFAASGQEHGGAITGNVRDPIGGIMVGAPVQAANTSTRTVYKATTSQQGAYTLSDLPPGTYDVSLTVPGVAPFALKNIAVSAGNTARLDIDLKEGSQLGTLGEDPLAIAADQKRHRPPSGPAPRTAEGKPDLTGVWWSPRTVDPGKPEFLPWAAEVARKRTEDNRKDSPQAHCLPNAVTRVGPLYEFVQAKSYLVMISDDDSPGFHQIYLDGRTHPKEPDPLWYGHSIGHWDGDTLVVDRVNFEEQVWLDQEAHPHSDKLHVIERYRRIDLGHLETEVTVEDPGILAKPWTMKRMSELAAGETIREFICTENNQDVPHLVGR